MKKKRSISYEMPKETENLWVLMEPDAILYEQTIQDVSVSNFASLSALLGFSQAEWAAILHISNRTLQRYLKDGTAFSGPQAELLRYLQRLANSGVQLFESPSSFAEWLRSPKQVLGRQLGFEALGSITGLRLLQNELGRIAHGVYI